MSPHVRVARPVGDLDRSVRMYVEGLGLRILGSFRDHEGFDGTMLGAPGAGLHFEFTSCPAHPVRPSPTPEDLVVFYLPDAVEWGAGCEAMRKAGFREVDAFNPYWNVRGRTFADPDGYRVVLQNSAWRDPAADREVRQS
ncbi:MAG: VOC family protein [Gemmatimonadetes bacterium]|nr:VOC family protein [Gemmatimonadota bacterium]